MKWFSGKGRKFILAVYITVPEIIFLSVGNYEAAEIFGKFGIAILSIYAGFNVGASIASVLKGWRKGK